MTMRMACIAGVLLAGAGDAQAAVYGWTITGATAAFTGAGTFTTQDVATAPPGDVADTNSGPAYLLTAFDGIFAGKTVRMKSWDPDQGPWYADNLFYPTGHYPFVDLDGLLFETLKADGSVAQIYNMFDSQSCGGDDGGCTDNALIGYPGIGAGKKVTFAFTVITPLPVTVVPEPSNWASMLGGFGLIGAALRRRRAMISFG